MEIRTAKGRLFLLLLLVITLPLLEKKFNFIESGKLKGAIIPHPNIRFSPAKWWDGSYQQQKSLYVNDSIGFRPDLIRLNNQIDFTLFKKLHAGDVFAGHDDYLFSKAYVDEYEGISYIGEDMIRDDLINLKMVQDTLERLDKTLVFTYAPSKPYFFPDNIPNILLPYNGQKTNDYSLFKRFADSLHIKQLDFNALFIAMKDTAHGALFTKQGTHWSIYGSLLAADTMIKFIERERKIMMPELVIKRMLFSDTARNADDDLAVGANLIFPITTEKFCYPEYTYTSDSAKTKPKAIFIGDSFLWMWIHDEFLQKATTDWEYWYYFNEVWNQKSINGGTVYAMNNYNWQKALQGTDCIIIVYTPMNFRGIVGGYGFIESMHRYFYPPKKLN